MRQRDGLLAGGTEGFWDGQRIQKQVIGVSYRISLIKTAEVLNSWGTLRCLERKT